MKYVLPFIILGVLVAGAVIFFPEEEPSSEERVQVTATFYPLGEFAAMVGEGHVALSVLTPSGADPHDFEPSPRTIVSLYESDIFLMQGAGFDPWAERVIPDLRSEGVRVIVMAEHFPLKDIGFGADPHLWLDPVLAIAHVELIGEAFSAVDPEGKSVYEENVRQAVTSLEELHRSYERHLASCETRSLITSHAAFTYLAERYHLDMIPISRLSPGEEPTPRELAQVIQRAREEGVRVVFYETLSGPELAETVAGEIEADLLPLHSLEGLTAQEKEEGQTYLSLMEENLQNLATGLSCS